MRRHKQMGKLSRETLQRAWPAAALLSALALAGAWFLQGTIPRHIVLASALAPPVSRAAVVGIVVENRGKLDPDVELTRDRSGAKRRSGTSGIGT